MLLSFDSKRTLSLILGLCLSCSCLFAETDDDIKQNDVGIVAGFNIPMYNGSGSGVIVGLTYSNWTTYGLGFRTGFQYTSKMLRVNQVVGAPVAVAYRTRSRDFPERLNFGANSAADSATGYRDGRSGVGNAFASFLVGLFSNAEFYAGITPGYIISEGISKSSTTYWFSDDKTYWEKSYVEVKHRFSTSLDAGLNLNYGIWRFDLKIMPAFHFNITDNYVVHISDGNSVEGETSVTTLHARWFFSICGGLTFNF